MSATLKIVIKVKDLPSNRFNANSFCDLVLFNIAQKGITGVLYYHITKQVVSQINQYLYPPLVENFLETRNKIPEAETYPSLINYVPERYVKREDSPQGIAVYTVDRDAIYNDLVEKDAEFVLRIPLPSAL